MAVEDRLMTGRDQQELVDANRAAISSIPDSELFRAATSEERVADEQPAEPEADHGQRARDEKGRFAAAKLEETPAEQPAEKPAATETKDEEGGQVPSWRVRELREARDEASKRAEQVAQQNYALQNQFEQMRRELESLKAPKAEPVDFYTNPDEALQQRIQPFQQNMQSLEQRLVMRASRAEAISEFGKPAIVEMEEAIGKALQSNNPDMHVLSAQMRSSDHPVGIAMQWFQRDKLTKETGGDLVAYRQKILDEAMKDPAFQAKVIETARGQTQPGQSKPNIQLPPSLNKTTGAAVAGDSENDMSDAGLFRQAVRPRR